jgi:predicted Zn-dependent protease
MVLLENLERMLVAGKDVPLLRFSLGNGYMKVAQPHCAVELLRAAVGLDVGYSAARKLLEKALADCGRHEDALNAYDAGIAAAEKHGDRQAAKEMTVFRRRVKM